MRPLIRSLWRGGPPGPHGAAPGSRRPCRDRLRRGNGAAEERVLPTPNGEVMRTPLRSGHPSAYGPAQHRGLRRPPERRPRPRRPAPGRSSRAGRARLVQGIARGLLSAEHRQQRGVVRTPGAGGGTQPRTDLQGRGVEHGGGSVRSAWAGGPAPAARGEERGTSVPAAEVRQQRAAPCCGSEQPGAHRADQGPGRVGTARPRGRACRAGARRAAGGSSSEG